MPNLIRHKRGHHSPPMLSHPVLRNAGTRLSLREREVRRYAEEEWEKLEPEDFGKYGPLMLPPCKVMTVMTVWNIKTTHRRNLLGTVITLSPTLVITA
jgi:hypothetical protein